MAVTAFAVTAPGLEALAAAELLTARIDDARAEHGGVTFAAEPGHVERALIRTRIASRVIVRAAEFRATSFAQLEKRAKAIAWETWLAAGSAAELRVTCRKSRLYHSDAVAERIAGAIASRITGVRVGSTSDEDETSQTSQLFVVRVLRDVCTISVDASGTALYKRGYREATAKAPIRETLAAAMLSGASWREDEPLLDPFCGSGTLVIEAALRARGISPGLLRDFRAERWPSTDQPTWERERNAARDMVRPSAGVPLHGSDRDEGAIRAADANAQRAGVSADVSFAVRSLSEATPASEDGLIITNPPYGVRVAPTQDLRNLYARFGQLIRVPFAGWRYAILFTDDAHGRELERQFDNALVPAWRSLNGGIPVRLMTSGAAGNLSR